ncbi:MAG: NUDIX hydrolase [Chloroflexota bacterium]
MLNSNQPTIMDATGRRTFSCSAAAVQAVIINNREEILMLSSPTRNADGAWQVISGALEAEETILAGVLREVSEEAGPDIRVRPLGVVHTSTFHYDEQVRYVITVYYLLAYEGGQVIPGDDMAGSEYRWWTLTDLLNGQTKIHLPRNQDWILNRAVDLYRFWVHHEPVNFETI